MRYLSGLFFVFALLLFSCDDDFSVYGDYEGVPVVYGLLNPTDSIQYIKISKTFQDADVEQTGLLQDSAYYTTELDLRLFEYEIIDTLVDVSDTSNWQRTNRSPIVFKLDSPGNYSVYSSSEKLKELHKYILELIIPGKKEKVSADVFIIGEFKVTRPVDYKIGYNSPVYMESYVRPYRAKWEYAKYGRLYEMTMKLNYYEYIDGDSVEDFIQFDYPTQTAREIKLPGDTRVFEMQQPIGGEVFFEAVGDSIKENPLIKRKVKDLDFFFYVADNHLFRYNSTYANRLYVPLYSNVKNGIGILACKYTFIVPGKYISDESKDSLAYGAYTKKLNFANFRGIWDDRLNY